MKGFFITGTDTGVGKTVVTAAVAAALKKRNLNISLCKPVQSGAVDGPLSGDLGFLLETTGLTQTAEETNLYTFVDPVTPSVAARKANQQIERDQILRFIHKLAIDRDCLLVEGVGGLLSPIGENFTNAELAFDLNLPILLVARAGLGTIHQTVATAEAARNRGLSIAGIILNGSKGDGSDPSEETNAAEIEKATGISILGVVPWMPEISVENKRFPNAEACGERFFNLDRLMEWAPSTPAHLEEDDLRFIWHPFTPMQEYEKDTPLVVEKGSGSYLIDVHGKKYIDGVSSLWVNLHGHRKSEMDRAAQEQIGKISHSTLLGITNRPAVELAKSLIQIAPDGLTKVFYSDNGSTAVEVALKMAYQYWQNKGEERKTFLSFENAYHGDTIGAVSVGGIQLFHGIFSGMLFKTLKVPYPEKKKYLENLDFILSEKHKDLAAVIVEPLVQGAAGLRMMVPGALKKIRELCDKHNLLLIADEVAVGFGRTGKMFACEHEEVSPDFLCLAKGITGGYLPLAATLTTEEIYRGFRADPAENKTFFHGHSYTGNPVGCAAGLANLEIFRNEKTLENLQPKIKLFQSLLEPFKEHAQVKQVRQKGFLAGIELMKSREEGLDFAPEERIGAQVCRRARDLGAVIRPLGNVIVIMPPLNIPEVTLRELMAIVTRSLEDTLDKVLRAP